MGRGEVSQSGWKKAEIPASHQGVCQLWKMRTLKGQKGGGRDNILGESLARQRGSPGLNTAPMTVVIGMGCFCSLQKCKASRPPQTLGRDPSAPKGASGVARYQMSPAFSEGQQLGLGQSHSWAFRVGWNVIFLLVSGCAQYRGRWSYSADPTRLWGSVPAGMWLCGFQLSMC